MDLYTSQGKLVEILTEQSKLLEEIRNSLHVMAAAALSNHQRDEDLIKKILGEGEGTDPITASQEAMQRMAGMEDDA